jgi:hypothetical protein
VQQLRHFGLEGMGLFTHSDTNGDYKRSEKNKTPLSLGRLSGFQEGADVG